MENVAGQAGRLAEYSFLLVQHLHSSLPWCIDPAGPLGELPDLVSEHLQHLCQYFVWGIALPCGLRQEQGRSEAAYLAPDINHQGSSVSHITGAEDEATCFQVASQCSQ